MGTETKSTISIAIISAISAVIIAVITTYGTIAVSAPEAKKVKKELEEITELQLIANLPVGTIVPSMLEPTVFTEAVGDVNRDTPQWELADGRSILLTSRYSQKSGATVAPDLRGVFLRGMNVNDGGKDPERNRKVGTYQKDAFARHHHGMVWHWRSFVGHTDKDYPKPAGDKCRKPPCDSLFEGGDETRPKNVAVYFYIKIN